MYKGKLAVSKNYVSYAVQIISSHQENKNTLVLVSFKIDKN
jgi:hypothetical protein